MRGKRTNLTVVLPVLLLLSWHDCAQAFSFCFSFGGRDNHRPRHHDYPPPLPGSLPGLYGGYPYSPVPVYPGYGGYYSLPYGVPVAQPVQGTSIPDTEQ